MGEPLVPVAVFSRSIEAELARTKLEAAGLHAFIADGHLVRINWLLSGAVGGVKLLVPRSDEERAIAVLHESPDGARVALREVFEDDGEELCPRCGSEETRGQSGSSFRVAIAITLAALLLAQPIVLLFVGLPVLFYRRRRRCFDCGHRWRES
ncbi:MAG: putative signal transducing protein [Myxococcota bacterium]